MATFFHGPSEIEADGLQTLYLMNPGYVGYSDAQTPAAAANMVFLNSAGHHPLTNATLAHHQQPPAPATQNHQHFVGIPLQPATAGDPTRPTVHHASQHEISGAVHGFIPRLHYNLWTSTDPNSTTATGTHQDHQAQAIPTTGNSSVSVSDLQSQLGISRSLQQGLSLSLSSQQTAYGQYRAESEIPAPAPAPVISPTSGEDMRVSGGSSSSASGVSNGTSGIQSVFLGSKYLKAAQQLLDEVVNVGNGIKAELSKGSKDQSKISREATVVAEEASNGGGEGEAATAKRGGNGDLTTAEKQELQMKKAKLVSMLDEVEQRYRQYHHQMQIVVSSFEQAAGLGSAKTYTALALQTISKQFRCLKDAISWQIRATSKSLGEEDYLGGGKGEGSRLRFVDHQLRQQRALQQLGMIQHNAWRPQRGLPERSVSILRAWLFEHFLHPYPKDSDKLMLAKQTGLTRSQVSNWFINARVRLWKPMVEEMYMEETKNEEQNGMDDKASKNELNEESGSRSTAHQENSPTRTDQTRNNPNPKQDSSIDPNAVPPSSINSNVTTVPSSTMEANMRRNMEANMRPQASFFLMRSPESESNMVQGNSKKSRNTTTELEDSPSSIHSMSMDMKPSETNREMCMKFEIERQNRNGYLGGGGGGGGGGGFGAYSIGEIGRFDPEQFTPRFSGNGVSLTLGLPHCENLPLSAAQQTYLSNPGIQLGRGLEIGGGDANNFCGINTAPPPSHSTTAYESINMQNRKRFAAQLLPDFVA